MAPSQTTPDVEVLIVGATVPFVEVSSGYFGRSRKLLPLQGAFAPWRLRQHYTKDARLLRGRIDDEALNFS